MKVYETPNLTVDSIRKQLSYLLFQSKREYWSVDTVFGTYHGFMTKKQAKEIGKSLEV